MVDVDDGDFKLGLFWERWSACMVTVASPGAMTTIRCRQLLEEAFYVQVLLWCCPQLQPPVTRSSRCWSLWKVCSTLVLLHWQDLLGLPVKDVRLTRCLVDEADLEVIRDGIQVLKYLIIFGWWLARVDCPTLPTWIVPWVDQSRFSHWCPCYFMTCLIFIFGSARWVDLWCLIVWICILGGAWASIFMDNYWAERWNLFHWLLFLLLWLLLPEHLSWDGSVVLVATLAWLLV